MKQGFFLFCFYQSGQENTKMFDLVTNSVDIIIIIISSSSINIIIIIILIIIIALNPRPTKAGVVTIPPHGLSPAAQKCKRKWPRASRTSLSHPLRSFWWKKTGGAPLDGGRVSCQSSKVEGWLPPQNILSRHFEEKNLHGMVLKLSGHVKNTISFFYMPKFGWNSDI